MVADVLVIGDLHAMSVEVDVSRFVRFVEANPAKTLVLAGDTLDFYVWKHGRGRVDVAAGLEVVRFLDGLAAKGVEIVVIPGNHDMEWMWLAQGGGAEEVPAACAIPGRHAGCDDGPCGAAECAGGE